jgi:hypothetical protein
VTVEVKPAPCLNCGKINDRLGGAIDEHSVPVPGDVTMCIECGHLAIYENPGRLREPTADELLEIMQDPEIQAVQLARRRIVG